MRHLNDMTGKLFFFMFFFMLRGKEDHCIMSFQGKQLKA